MEISESYCARPRIDAGLEQRELAQMMNVSAAFVSDLERGRRPFHDRIHIETAGRVTYDDLATP